MGRKGKPYAGFNDPQTGFARPGRRPVKPATQYPGLVVDPGTLYIRSLEIPKPKYQVTCLLDEAPPKVLEGYGGWTLVTRSRRKSITEFTGESPLLVEIAFMLDHWDEEYNTDHKGVGIACEAEFAAMEAMSGLGASGKVEPPRLLWDANSPHDTSANPSLTWVVESLQWGDKVLRNDAGNIIRQNGVIQLREYVGDVFLSTAADQSHTKAGNKGGHRGGGTYTTKNGDTLQNIARQLLGSVKYWKEIYKLNKKNIKNPKHLKPHTVLKIPKI